MFKILLALVVCLPCPCHWAHAALRPECNERPETRCKCCGCQEQPKRETPSHSECPCPYCTVHAAWMAPSIVTTTDASSVVGMVSEFETECLASGLRCAGSTWRPPEPGQLACARLAPLRL